MQGLESFKPILTALVLPPVPWLLLIFVGLHSLRLRPRFGRAAIVAGAVLIWLSCCMAPAQWLHRVFGLDLTPLDAARLAEFKADADAAHTTILVLGAGMVPSRDEPGRGELNGDSRERLIAGIRLARATGWPLAFSGGRGWAQRESIEDSEAEAARRSAERDFGFSLAWIEPQSRDTAENATRSIALLRKAQARRVMLVSDSWHLPRARALFERASGGSIRVVPVPIGDSLADQAPWLEWMPSARGFEMTRTALREALGMVLARTTSEPPSREISKEQQP